MKYKLQLSKTVQYSLIHYIVQFLIVVTFIALYI